MLKDLRELFQLFVDYNISISPTKTYLGYPDVNLLGQRVESLGLTSPEDKLRAISNLRYPTTLGALEHYLGLTGSRQAPFTVTTNRRREIGGHRDMS